MSDFIYEKRTYHGTRWERPWAFDDATVAQFSQFENLNPLMCELQALYTTDIESVSEFFSENKIRDPENEIEVVIQGTTRLKNPYVIEFKYGQEVMFNGEIYKIENPGTHMYGDELTRKDLHAALREAGYDGFIMKNDYQYMGDPADDVAILNDSAFEPETVKMKINGKWTRELPIERARSVFKKWAAAPYLESGACESQLSW